MTPLVVPPAAQRDERAIQMLSAWIAENGLHCTMKIGMWKEAGHNESRSWGVLLADVVRHISKAMQDQGGEPADQTTDQIVQSLLHELDSPSSKITGGFSPGHS
jgi:hypothetical protein